MNGKIPNNPQLNVFRTPLVNVINIKHELVLLAQKTDWEKVEKEDIKLRQRYTRIVKQLMI